MEEKDMSIVKFNLILNRLFEYFDKELISPDTFTGSNKASSLPLVMVVGKNNSNVYVEQFKKRIPHDLSFGQIQQYYFYYCFDRQKVWYSWIDSDSKDIEKCHKIISSIQSKLHNSSLYIYGTYKSCGSWQEIKVSSRFVRDIVIFWNLFLASIDDEIWNQELPSIVDLAYGLDFTKDMMSDWCRAVEYVFEGNMFHQNCNLQCDTDEAKRFFLHKGIKEVNRTLYN